MLKILDWYILKKFLSTTFFMVLIFSVISVVIDTSEKTDDFVKSGLSTWQIITKYYVGFVPFIISMIFPLMVFIAVIFFTSKMAGRSEIVAMLAGGIKYTRLLRPFMLGALLLGGFFWYATQFLLPKAAVLRGNFQATYIDSKSSYEQGEFYKKSNTYYIRVDTNTFAGLRQYDTVAKLAKGGFWLDRIKGTEVVYNLRADYVKWDTAKKGWKLENAVERKIDGLKETVKLIPSMDIKLNVRPNEIRPDKYLKDKMTTPQLMAFIRQEEARGTEGLNDFKVERYRRDATPASVLILTLIGVSVASRKTRGGSGLNLAVGIITAAIFVVMDKFSLTFSTKGDFPPLLAAWTPNIIFTFVAIWLYRLSPK
ncbi:MAG: LptF/LptG family permease [Candidatus Pseudobacter hemicellulosilyticus]|uniref:LptF/LptG family permease n=1 Tax=Candidatus Pseudobacter hemicellulosilyticus TaxID=3121375 RepID=A0AAJ5WY69_9BACT|nr:MAG: LptF/LptG family permease [Pseudobacter sp.]